MYQNIWKEQQVDDNRMMGNSVINSKKMATGGGTSH
jgi:hypothetical protein